METHIFASLIGKDLGISEQQVDATISLLDSGATIPFISRYRKEATGALDEVQVGNIHNGYEKLKELEKRKQTILSGIEAAGKLTDSLRSRIEQTWDSTTLEDIYRPYKPKRRTRASVAKEKGLEPLANAILLQTNTDIRAKAESFISEDLGVTSAEDAINGAKDIIAERINEDERSRAGVRASYKHEAIISSHVVKGKEEEAQKFSDYFDASESLARCASHRILAMRRGESAGFLRVSITANSERCQEKLRRLWVRGNNESSHLVEEAIDDALARLMEPSIETEFAALAKEKADAEAIAIFTKNLEQLLMAAPLGQKRVLGIDPGIRTGCKVVCLDAEGNLLYNTAIYPFAKSANHGKEDATKTLETLIQKYAVEAIAIGSGTAGRETEELVRQLHLPQDIEIYMVNEDGASIYSASQTAREEFPDYDVTVRGAVSIGRRLMDPLAELVKIDPSSIGVGQYQKDVNQKLLSAALDQTVVSCVNKVGVNVNTASKHLLTYISGLGPMLAQNIVNYRAANGAFKNRKQLLKVTKMGPKAFEQAAGFLRIRGGENPLDNTAVHPESYPVVERIAKDQGCSVEELISDRNRRTRICIEQYVTPQTGLPTLRDIMNELDKPGRDPRGQLEAFSFSNQVHTLEDVSEGMVLPGIITNITNFGCFVDVGVHVQGLVHISQLANHFVKDPATVVSLRQTVMVKVIGVDLARKRLSLSMKDVQ